MKSKSFRESLKHALSGLKYCVLNERNFKYHIAAAVMALALAILLGGGVTKLLFIVFAIFFVLCAEIFNTAVEAFCDMITEDYNKFAKIAKDCSAAAVLISAINAVVVGLIVFLPEIFIII